MAGREPRVFPAVKQDQSMQDAGSWKGGAERKEKHLVNLNTTILTLWALDTLGLQPAYGTCELVSGHDLQSLCVFTLSLSQVLGGGWLSWLLCAPPAGGCPMPGACKCEHRRWLGSLWKPFSLRATGPAGAAWHFVQLSFSLTGPSLSFRRLPSIPFQLFPLLLLKSGCFLC